ncbi:MAG: 16S rRNA (guanine(966)-N(2))-methyltransferase RsmD [Gammaproteobacteria bacterium]|nr:16S rRNA (guanine(966)-N(2))-methyltransferase RsmD [Gammaproteobacteria bacterium]
MRRDNLGKLRIIGGRWRSRVLPVIEQAGLRPTPDRVRETLFNWLQAYVPGAQCLDLYAGSGALGFEAASRGAAGVVLIEQQAAACQLLAENIKTLQAPNISLHQQDALAWLRGNQQVFDLVFLDPPYDADLLAESCRLLEDSQSLSEGAAIYLELSSQHELPALPENWHIIRGKKAGQVSYHLAIRQPIQDTK